MSDDYITVKDKDTSENIQWIEKKEKPKKWITKKEKPKKWITKKVRTHHFNSGKLATLRKKDSLAKELAKNKARITIGKGGQGFTPGWKPQLSVKKANKGGIKKANMGDYIIAQAVEKLNPRDMEAEYKSGGEIVVGKNVDKDLL